MNDSTTPLEESAHAASRSESGTIGEARERLPQIVVVGAGEISDYHIEGIRAAGAEVSMIVSRSEQSAAAKADQFGIPAATADLGGALESGATDGIVLATPDSTHLALALRTIEAGIPTMIQKPLAMTSSDCRVILAASAAAGTPVYTSFMHRYFEEVTALEELIARGALGEVLHVRHRNATGGAGWAPWFYDNSKVGGGVLLQLGVHGIDLIRHVFGDIVSVRATSACQVRERVLDSGETVYPDLEDLMVATYALESGTIVTHEMSYNEVAGTDRFRMEVYGTLGTAWLRSERGRLAIAMKEDPSGWSTPKLGRSALGELHHRHFVRMALGSAPDDESGFDGFMAVVIAEHAYEAASTGRTTEVPQ